MSLSPKFLKGDAWHSLTRSPGAMLSMAIVLSAAFLAVFAPWVAPQNPLDLASLNLMDGLTPPSFMAGGNIDYPLGTDNQGRDILSAILYGARTSLIVGLCAVTFSTLFGTAVGMIAGYRGGIVDAVLMRAADIQLTFPSLLIALLIDGIAKAVLPQGGGGNIEIYVVIFAISVSEWPKFARTARGSTIVERDKEYVLAARIIGVPALRIGVRHILPNILGPLVIVSMLSLGLAILTEATLSFLGVGVPPSQPSLGTLIRIGNDYVFSGEWWIALFPGLALTMLVVSVNLSGDWLRDIVAPESSR